jgi:exodeoxyribonuclease V alpha subunit
MLLSKHLSFRVAWHDNKWNGRICKDPQRNVYCRGNYSLLSPRLQRRIRLDIENKAAKQGKTLAELIQHEKYLPPCFWSINIFGDTECKIADYHPFSDIPFYQSRFERVPPLEDSLSEYSGFTWYFRLGFSDVEGEQYVPQQVLESRVKKCLGSLKPGKSIVFFYVNYSNPVSGNDYKYVLVGAGLVEKVEPPKKYDIPPDVMLSVQAQSSMRNFNPVAWQFKICLNKESLCILPYHDYLNFVYSCPPDEREEKWDKLNQIAVTINDKTIIPSFKYVSRQVSSDQAIYLLCSIKKKIEKMKEHGIVNYEEITTLESKINALLEVAWKERGRYPGFKNILSVFFKNNFGSKSETIIDLMVDVIVEEYGSIENYLEGKDRAKQTQIRGALEKAFKLASENFEKIAFLAQFDFTTRQFENIMTLLRDINFQEVKKNPYLILEKYHFKPKKEEVMLEDSDFGLGLYNFDIALIPDFDFVDWSTDYHAESPERLRAVIREILTDSALNEGSSCLTRSEILSKIEEYPLYYINERFRIDVDKLVLYEQNSIFRDAFLITPIFGKDDVIYQLLSLREIEDTIQLFLQFMFNKSYKIREQDKIAIDEIVNSEKEKHGPRLLEEERRRLYYGIHENGFFAVTGKAGSGKTSAVVRIVSKFLADGKYPIYIFTPTGKANLVIKRRLKESGLKLGPKLQVSTIHRFLFTALFDTKYPQGFKDAIELREKVERILDGRFDLFHDFKKAAERWQFNPIVVIIDESSMADEVLLALLLCMLNPDAIKHFILVGDERQLPPIGVGKPLVDTLYYLKKKELENKLIRLESSLRFDINSSLGLFAEQFGSTEIPLSPEIAETLAIEDEHLELHYFNEQNIKSVVEGILRSLDPTDQEKSLFERFADIFEKDSTLNLDKIQIITPRRVGNFGSEDINLSLVLDGNFRVNSRTKLICEENLYHDMYSKGKKKRILGLANGSMGYITKDNEIYFDDIEDLKEDYDPASIQSLINKVKKELYNPLKIERTINLGYSITIHKSQGSDFEYVVLVIPEKSAFITKELLYTAVTRAERKLFLLVNETLKEELPFILSTACENSVLAQRKTLLFGYKTSTFKPYSYKKKDGTEIEVRSKIELLVAKALDENDVEYIYEPDDFYQEFRIWPDFKLNVDGKSYYLEHLGDMTHKPYKDRWFKKWQIYNEKLCIGDIIITTEERKEKSNIDAGIKKIIKDIKSSNLAETRGAYSYHHYQI